MTPSTSAFRHTGSLVFTTDLSATVAGSPTKVALRDEVAELTYQDMWDASAALAGGLADIGVTAGAHVLAMLDNSIDYALTVTAINFLGAVVVPVNTMHKGSILEHVVRDSQAHFAICEGHYFSTLMSAAGEGLLEKVVVRGEADAELTESVVAFADVVAGSAVAPVERHEWDPFMVGYTSGTTGLSKGVVLSNAYCMTVSDPIEVQRVIGDEQVFYVVCPMFHLTGMAGGLFGAIAYGGTMHIAGRFSASSFAADATKAGATATTLVGSMVDFILRQPELVTDADCTVRSVAMIPMHPRVEEFKRRFNVEVRTSFGGTESNAILLADDDEAFARRASGRARPGFEVRVVDEHDREVPVGEPGELVVRCERPWLTGGEFLGNPIATAAAWRNGWLHTGDLLKRDSDGYYYFVDRKKDAIRRRGENISSVEVEREVLAHPDVAECAAIGVATEHMEQEVKVFVIRREGSDLTEAELIHFLIERMPRYSVPRYVQFAEELPRTATAKVRKEVLRNESNWSAWDREAAGIVVPR